MSKIFKKEVTFEIVSDVGSNEWNRGQESVFWLEQVLWLVSVEVALGSYSGELIVDLHSAKYLLNYG